MAGPWHFGQGMALRRAAISTAGAAGIMERVEK